MAGGRRSRACRSCRAGAGELQALQIRFDSKPFAAHVTLLRDVPAGRSTGSSEVVEPIERSSGRSTTRGCSCPSAIPTGATCYRALDPSSRKATSGGTVSRTLRRAGRSRSRAARALQRIIL